MWQHFQCLVMCARRPLKFEMQNSAQNSKLCCIQSNCNLFPNCTLTLFPSPSPMHANYEGSFNIGAIDRQRSSSWIRRLSTIISITRTTDVKVACLISAAQIYWQIWLWATTTNLDHLWTLPGGVCLHFDSTATNCQRPAVTEACASTASIDISYRYRQQNVLYNKRAQKDRYYGTSGV